MEKKEPVIKKQVVIDPKLHKRLSIRAAQVDRTISEMVEDGVRHVLKRPKKPKAEAPRASA